MDSESNSKQQAGEGRRSAEDLFAVVYDELKQQARRQRAGWIGDYTLNTTAVVHEAYLKLTAQPRRFENKGHFLCVASKAMRQLLVDYSRRRLSEKRGGDRRRVTMSHSRLGTAGQVQLTEEKAAEVLALDWALSKLRQQSERLASVVDCRFFGGLSIAETAEALGISPATVKRDWVEAQMRLYRELAGRTDPA